MTPPSPNDGEPGRPVSRRSARRRLVPIAGAAMVLAGLLTFLMVVADARIEAATFGLVAIAGALGFFLATLRRMAVVLARPEVDTLLAVEGRSLGARELLAEKRRVLRAIKELDFDHAMGKLSDADYHEVRKRYEVRALEVLVAAEGAQALHPGLAADLARLGQTSPAQGSSAASDRRISSADVAAPEARSEGEAAACADCKTPNDPDARFCKHCGAKLKP